MTRVGCENSDGTLNTHDEAETCVVCRPLRVQCAWCGVLIREGELPISHGCCPPCADRMIEQIRARRAAKEAAK